MNIKKKDRSPLSSARSWFLLALGLSSLFLVYTAINATGVLDISTLSVERWWLNRPISRLDCVFLEWRRVGDMPMSLFLVLALGMLCWRAGYSWKVVPVLLVLLVLCVSVEYIGKQTVALALPRNLHSGMTVLTCPQMQGKPLSVRIEAMAGLWWKIPDPPAEQVSWAGDVAKMPVVPGSGSSFVWKWSYPGGHAMRWCFLGFIASWLCWRHMRQRVWRMLFTILFFLASFSGGFMQFYIGVHVITDTVAGYLLGAAGACCAIGFLIIYHAEKKLFFSKG